MKNISLEKKYNQDRTLFVKAKNGDNTALEQILKENERLLIAISNRYNYISSSKEDIMQVAYMGLIKAVRKFDFSYNVEFSTYAVEVVSGEIKTYFRNDSYIKTSRYLKNLYLKARTMKDAYAAKTGEEITIDCLAEELGCDKLDIVSAFEACSAPVYLEQRVSDDSEASIGDFIEDKTSSFDSTIDKMFVSSIIGSLPSFYRKLITLRFLLGKTQMQTAKILGISQVQVSRKEKKIIEDLKKTYLPQ